MSAPQTILELDRVVLLVNLPAQGLTAGDVGTVVMVHRQGEAFEVEFCTLAGRTYAVTTLLNTQVRPVAASDLNHVRSLAG